MAKKKKAKKKVHRRHAAQPTVTPAAASSASLPSEDAIWRSQKLHSRGQTADGSATPRAETARWSYVGGDVRRIGLLAGSCIVAELALWYLFSYTGLGAAVYGLIK